MGLRKERLGDEIRDIIAECLTGGKMRDPRLQLVTITAVKLSADLQLASVYFRVMNDADKESTEQGLRSAAGFFRNKLSDELDIRRAPLLKFFYDTSVEYGSNIERLLTKIND